MVKKINSESPTTEERLLTRAQGIFDNARNFREQEIEPRWEKDNDLYNARFAPNERKTSGVLQSQGRLFIPKTFAHVQRMLADVHDTFTDESDEFVDVGSWKDIPFENREIVKALLNYRLNGNPVNFYAEAMELCLDALNNKVGIFKVWPKLRVTTTKKTFDDGSVSDFSRIDDYVPMMDCVPYEDMFFDQNATWKTYWRFPIIHRMLKSVDYLKRRGYKTEGLETSGGETSSDLIKTQRDEVQGTKLGKTEEAKTRKGMVYIFEIWDFMESKITKGLFESVSYVMAGTETSITTLIRDVEVNELPYKFLGDDYVRPPFVVGTSTPDSHVMYGKSIPQTVEGLQKETNAQRNQRREAVALAMRKPILASKTSGLDLMGLVNRKIGSVVMGNNIGPESVRELNISPPGADSILEQRRTDQDFFETTSVPPALLGSGNAEQTATGVTSQNVNANKKIGKIIKNLAATAFVPAMNMLLRLEQEYATDEFISKVTGRILGWRFSQDGIPPRESIQGEFELKVSVLSSKALLLNKFMLIFDRGNQANLASAQMVQAGVVDPSQVSFVDLMGVYDRMLTLLGEKDVQGFKFPAQQPPAQQGAVPGQASQPRLPDNGEASISNVSPEGIGGNF